MKNKHIISVIGFASLIVIGVIAIKTTEMPLFVLLLTIWAPVSLGLLVALLALIFEFWQMARNKFKI